MLLLVYLGESQKNDRPIPRLDQSDIMNADTRSYLCKTCNQRVEYTYPIKFEYVEDSSHPDGHVYLVVPIDKKHHKRVAKFNHDKTHKGELDNFVKI